MDRVAFKHHPLNLPLFRTPFELEFDTPITILVGANGSGKSMIIEAIVAACGFSLSGGTRHVAYMQRESKALSQHLRFSWLPGASGVLLPRRDLLAAG